MDSIVHMENDRLIGRTNFRSGLLNSVVALSVKEVPGVARISPTYGFSLHGIKTYLKSRHGIAIVPADDYFVIEICIWIDYGFSAADVCYRVQENVINAASSMTDRKIKAVNIKIANADIPYFEANA